ncbi:hypothetical protein PNV01_13395 [Turicibacter sanguinis]|uniref:hypothetical protein n=1 Tax=Turicibacter sanguinis TaxID=154288 RepID=UPI00233121D2|nr:hypothetical protein [Turicibacter sanguinis]MDB8545798.1 hypothetical protein [Turicibacter sanguinis]
MEIIIGKQKLNVGDIFAIYMEDEDNYFEGEIRRHPTNGLYWTDGECVVFLANGMKGIKKA